MSSSGRVWFSIKLSSMVHYFKDSLFKDSLHTLSLGLAACTGCPASETFFAVAQMKFYLSRCYQVRSSSPLKSLCYPLVDFTAAKVPDTPYLKVIKADRFIQFLRGQGFSKQAWACTGCYGSGDRYIQGHNYASCVQHVQSQKHIFENAA
jgi:hypothetical protein